MTDGAEPTAVEQWNTRAALAARTDAGYAAGYEACREMAKGVALAFADSMANNKGRPTANSIAAAIAALPAPGNEATEEQVAREICLSYGRDPDEPSDPMEMCDANNQPVPTWRIYEEQAGDLLSTYTITRKSQSEERV